MNKFLKRYLVYNLKEETTYPLYLQNDEDLVAEEMRRTTEAAASEDTMFGDDPVSDNGQQLLNIILWCFM